MNRTLDVLTSFVASSARFGYGATTTGHAERPAKLLELYEMEGCPFCRKVREALTALDLDAMIYPCPKGGEVYRPRVVELGGKALFPFLVDPNTGTQMYESSDIVDYLFRTYGKGKPGLALRLGPVTDLTSMLASAARPGRGLRKRPSRQPDEPLELYSFEASPFSRTVRETLTELELPYVLRNVGKGNTLEWLPTPMRERFVGERPLSTENRRAFAERSGRMMVPFLVDPNTGVEMFESAEIKAYLVETYGLG